MDKILYTICNPVAAALVPKSSQYPGVVTQPADYRAGPVEVSRPPVFFREQGPTPKTVKLEIVPPPGFEENSSEGFVEMLEAELEAREADLRLQHQRAGRPILGRKGVLEEDRFGYPHALEPRRGLCPRIGAKNKWGRIEAIRRLKSFIVDHAKSLARWVAGEHDVEFPFGTYWARVYLGAKCLGPG
jgi:hypothetical protein